MNPFRFLLTFLALVSALPVFSQSFTIEGVDAGAFPGITVRIRNNTGKALEKPAVTVFEGNKAVPDFNLSISSATANTGDSQRNKDAGGGNGGAVLFLIENGGFTSAQQISAVKTAIASTLRNTKSSALANICYFNRTRSGGAMNRISSDFTADYAALISDMNRRIAHSPDAAPNTDLYKALYECIEYMAGKNNLTGNKQIILIATGHNNGGSPIDVSDCSALAAKNEIKVNSIGLRSGDINATDNVKLAAQNMDGRYEAGSSVADIERALNTFLNSSNAGSAAKPTDAPAPQSGGSIYTITYNSNADGGGEVVPVEITIGNVTQKTTYTVPAGVKSKGGGNRMLYYLIGGGVVLAALIIGLLLAQNTKKKKAAADAEARRQQDAERRRQADEADARKQEQEVRAAAAARQQQPTQFAQPQPQVKAANEDAAHRTVVGGIKMPQLFVTAGGITQTYNLTGAAMSIGRDAGSDIVINSPNISRTHATISMENGVWYITDNGSTNGVMTGGKRVQRSAITSGAQLLLGDAICTFVS